MDITVFTESHSKGGINEEQSKKVQHPMKPVDEDHSDRDEHCPHQQGKEDPPEKNLMMIKGRDPKVNEYHEEHKEVIYAQGLFDQIAGKELQGLLVSPEDVNADTEQEGKQHPERGPKEGLPDFDFAGLEMKPKIKGYHRNNKNCKYAPTKKRCQSLFPSDS
jgi:hypothetical protein